ncbi:MAG: acyltransferase family protein [Arcicella sp.]|jgi:hypothetical protein|nr:acyltransferase family protein [Arcicella sp.]
MERRYDIDWVRIIAILLLVIYHTAIGFQPWGGFIGFITNTESWQQLWIPMMMLNIWRIPLLFYLSGMGLYLALQNRNWKQLLIERFLRIGLPLMLGSVLIVPLNWYLLQYYYKREITYTPSMGHLWFLGNILLYVVILSPICFFLKNKAADSSITFIKKIIHKPYFLLFIFALFQLELVVTKPAIFEMYAFSTHGFLLGLLAFFTGFLSMLGGAPVWKMLLQWQWLFTLIAITLFVLRVLQKPTIPTSYLLAIESNCWVFSVVSFAYKYLNKDSKTLNYLKEAAYPVYILHMVFLFLGSILIFPLKIGVILKFISLVIFTLAGSLILFELIIRRFNILRVIFGLKVLKKNNTSLQSVSHCNKK